MQERTSGSLTILLVFFMISVAGCTTTYKQVKSWEGRTIEDLYWAWGKADEVVDYGADGRVYTWLSTWTDDGEEKTCRKSFTARNDGRGEVIVGTSYSDCRFLTLQ